jgi:hypothetical protein
MKALAITLALITSILTAQASDLNSFDKGKRGDSKKERLQSAVNHQINRHIYNPGHEGNTQLEGKADVMLQLMPEGDVQVVLIQTANPLMKKFIEKQVKKMKVDKNEVVAGEIFKYRFVFRAKE